MCVIMVVQKNKEGAEVRPTDEMIEKAWDSNPDGGGVAWRERVKIDGKVETVVKWHKGITSVEDMKQIMSKLTLPYIAHFRIQSVGGVKRSLTHPYVVSAESPLDLEGFTRGAVLFHNGHWGAWNDKAFEAAIMSNTKIPVGDWSDTRALAWLMHIYGPGVMELLPSQKGVFFTPTKTDVFLGGGWVEINGVWCSNNTPEVRKFKHSGGHHGGNVTNHYNYCNVGKCYNQAQTGKSICFTCEEKLKKEAKTSDPMQAGTTTGNKGQTKVTAMTVFRGGQQGNNDPLSEALTLAEADGLLSAKGMSRSQQKRFHKLYGQLKRAQSDKRKRKLQERILDLSQEVAEALVHG